MRGVNVGALSMGAKASDLLDIGRPDIDWVSSQRASAWTAQGRIQWRIWRGRSRPVLHMSMAIAIVI
jgi:hypothetical protein